MRIQKFKENDATQVRELIETILKTEYAVASQAYPGADLENPRKSYGGARESFFVAKDDGRVVGTVAVKEEDGDTALMRRLFVDPLYRGRGYGAKLVDKAIRFCREKKFKKLVFRGAKQMERALALSKRKGFEHRDVVDFGNFQIYVFIKDLTANSN